MPATNLEMIAHTEADAIRAQFETDGFVGVAGLIDTAFVEAAISQADRIAFPPHRDDRPLGEEATTLRTTPNSQKQKDLYEVLLGVEEAAAMLGRDITPSSRAEKPHIQIIRQMPGVMGRTHRDNDSLTDVVAITNLRGQSGFWIEREDGDEVAFTINPGELVIHDLRRRLWHRGYNTQQTERVGLGVAKLRPKR
jgi:hypothetical protein